MIVSAKKNEIAPCKPFEAIGIQDGAKDRVNLSFIVDPMDQTLAKFNLRRANISLHGADHTVEIGLVEHFVIDQNEFSNPKVREFLGGNRTCPADAYKSNFSARDQALAGRAKSSDLAIEDLFVCGFVGLKRLAKESYSRADFLQRNIFTAQNPCAASVGRKDQRGVRSRRKLQVQIGFEFYFAGIVGVGKSRLPYSLRMRMDE
jgi:hypothetical protein